MQILTKEILFCLHLYKSLETKIELPDLEKTHFF